MHTSQLIKPGYVEQVVYYDSSSVYTGLPAGTSAKPVNNETDMRAICIARSIKTVVLRGTTTTLQFTSALSDMNFVGEGVFGATPTVNFNGKAITCTFDNLRINDAAGDNLVSASQFYNCYIIKIIAHTVGGSSYFNCVFAAPVTNPPLGIINLYEGCSTLGDLINTTGQIYGFADFKIGGKLSMSLTGDITISGNVVIVGDPVSGRSIDSNTGNNDFEVNGDLTLLGGIYVGDGNYIYVGGDLKGYSDIYVNDFATVEIRGDCIITYGRINVDNASFLCYGNLFAGLGIWTTDAQAIIEVQGECKIATDLRIAGQLGYPLFRLVGGYYNGPTATQRVWLTTAQSKCEVLADINEVVQVYGMLAGSVLLLRLNGARVTIDVSCTGGSIYLFGQGEIIANAGAATIYDYRTGQKNTRFFQEAVAATDVNGVTWKDLLDSSVITSPVRICGFMVTKGAGWAGNAKIRIVDGVGTTKIFPFQTEYVEGTDFTSATQLTLNFPVEVSVSKGYKFQFRSDNILDGAGETLALDNLDVQELS